MPNGELPPAGDEKGSGALVSDTPSEVDRETNIRKAQLQGANRTYSTYMTYIHRQRTTDNLLLTTDQKTKCTRHKVQSSRAKLVTSRPSCYYPRRIDFLEKTAIMD